MTGRCSLLALSLVILFQSSVSVLATVSNISYGVDNFGELWVDGISVHTANIELTKYVVSADLYYNSVIAIKATNTGGLAGIMASFVYGGTQYVSSDTWQCTGTEPISSDWLLYSYVPDSTWVSAVEQSSADVPTWGINGMISTAKFIWHRLSSQREFPYPLHETSWCRFVIPQASTISVQQSSNYDDNDQGYGASRAFDGNMGTFSHTWGAPASMTIDLGGIHTIKSITVYNRQDCCGSRLNGYALSVSSVSGISQDGNGNGNYYISNKTWPETGAQSEVITKHAVGQYIYISLDADVLSLAEIRIQHDLLLCPAGSHSNPYANSTHNSCLQCTPGTYSNQTGASSCTLCPVGSYSNTTGASSCEPCSAGLYSPFTGATSCFLCPTQCTAPTTFP